MRKLLATGLFAALSCLAAGCGINTSPADLVRAPAVEFTQKELNQSVMDFLPPGARLVVPLHPENASAITRKDLDGDGSDEVIAFYKKDKNDYQIGVLVLGRSGDRWTRIANLEGLGVDVDYLDFPDLTGNGVPEMVIGWSGGANLDRELSVYSLHGKQLTQMWTQSYTEQAIGDLNNDGKAEITILRHNHEKLISTAELYAYSGGTIKKIDELPMEGGINGYEQVLFGKATPTQNGVFVDIGMGAHSAYTALLVMENNHLVSALKQGDDEIALTFKAYSVLSEDVNHDGVIEIGIQKQPPGTEELAMAEIPWINVWYQWNGSKLVPIQEDYANYAYQFVFRIPQKWLGSYTVKNEQAGESTALSFYYIEESPSAEAKLLTLRLANRQEWGKLEEALKRDRVGYTLLAKGKDQVIVALQPNGQEKLSHPERYKQLLLTEAEIREHFRTIHE